MSTDFVTKYLFEPNLLVPGKKPIGPVEIDRSNPLTKGLTSLILFNEGSGEPRELVSNSFGVRDATGVDWEINQQGRILDFDGSSRVDFNSPLDSISVTQEYTFILAATITAIGSNFGGIFSFNRDGGTLAGVTLQREAKGIAVALSHGNTRTSFGAGFRTTDIADSIYHVFVISHNPISNVTTAYIDGIEKDTATNATAIPALQGPLRIGSARDNVFSTGEWSFFGALNRGLSPAEVVSISADLYQVLKPATAQIYNFTSVAAPTGFQPAWARGANTIIQGGLR